EPPEPMREPPEPMREPPEQEHPEQPPEQIQNIAPAGAWIEVCKVGDRNFRQAYWRSNVPMFQYKRAKGDAPALTKKQYIGKENGTEHQAAIAMVERRKELRKNATRN
ncbi:MAG: hypothetical protein WCD18_15905, partial [Thermosynechococcaceae cyanobacterium]